MIIRIYNTATNVNVLPNVARVVRVYNQRVPSGITETAFDAKGDLLVGTGDGTYETLPVGSTGQYLTPDSSAPTGLKYEAPSVSITDPTNFLINGGFDFAQEQTPGTLTTIADGAYSADQWKCYRENADLQFRRVDASSESLLTSTYYGEYKKITNAGKILICQPIEFLNTLRFRGRALSFQLKMKASSAKTIKIAIAELQSGGTADTIPAVVSSWNADATDPTFGANIALIASASSCSVTTGWQTFQFTGSLPTTSKNLLVLIWSDADMAANDTLSLAEAGLYYGSTVISWNPRDKTVELQLVQRYCWKSFEVDIAPAQNVGGLGIRTIAGKAGAVSQMTSFIFFPVIMHKAPTITLYNPSAANAQVRDGTAGADCSSSSVTGWNTRAFQVNATGNASTAVGNILVIHALAKAQL